MRKILLLTCFISLNLLMASAQDVDMLMNQAKQLLEQSCSAEASLIFEKIVETDPQNYESLAFLGNYNYLLGKQMLDKVEAEYKTISQPNRMQTAYYQEELKHIYDLYYEKADGYLTKALHVRENEHLNKLLQSIQTFKKKMEIITVKSRKS